MQLNVTETPVLNQSLTVGSQTQEVTVQADTETIQTATSTLGTVVAAQTVTDLPLSTRNYTNLIAMTAGASADVNNANALGKGGMFTFVNGSNSEQNNYQMDGAAVNDWFSFGTTNEMGSFAGLPIPNPDAIQEFKIQTSTYDAGYGRNPGANVNVVTKSGTNAFHGTGFEFFRNSFLNANEWFNKRTQLGNTLNGVAAPLPNKPPVLNQNQYGGTFGGPIKKDKLFFFVSYQETGQKNGLSLYGFQSPVLPPIPGGSRGTCTTPNWTSLSQCDAATASFVTALATAISPTCAANSKFVKQDTTATAGSIQVACPGSTVASGTNTFNINPVAINLLQQKLGNGNYHIPGSTTGPYSVNSFSSPALYKEHQGMGNFDYTINSKNTLSGRYFYTTDPTSADFSCGVPGLVGSCLPGDPVSFQYTDHATTLKLTSIVTNNFVNEARLSFQRFGSVATNLTPFTDSQVGITPLTPAVNALSQIVISGGFQIGANYVFGLNIVEQQTEYADQVSWTRGKHSFRFGAEFEHDNIAITLPGADIGQPNFSSFPDFLIGRAGCPAFTGSGTCGTANPGNTNGATASNISQPGTSTQLRANNGLLEQKYLADAISAFAQDDIKVNSQLTVNLGLRWEWTSEGKEGRGGWSGVWPTLISQAPIPGTGCAVNGVIFGAGGTGTGCSLVGFEAPSNFQGPIPAGVYKSNQPYITQGGFPLDNFAPRIGFAWQPMANNNRLVVRGGGGYFYDRPNAAIELINAASTPPFAIVPATSPLATLASPFVVPPSIPGPAGTPGWTPRWVFLNSSGTATSSNLAGKVITQNFTTGLLYEWNLNTQYEFLPTWVLEMGYVGSRGIHQTGGYNSNLTETVGSNNPPINIANLAGPSNPLSCGYDGTAADCITTNTTQNVNLRVPYLGFSPTFAPKASAGQTKYNSLQVTVRKQLSHGLQVQAAYTWSRSFINWYVGNPAATSAGVAPYINPYGPNTYYHPQRLVFNYTWELPLGKHDGVMGQVLNGWNWTGVTTIQGGTPLLITDTRAGSLFASAGSGPIVLATLCPGVTNAMVPTSGSLTSRVVSGQTGGPGYFNKTGVFCAPQTVSNGTGYGGYGLGEIFGPGQQNWDMSLSKTFKINESKTLQFRTELFNTFNHTQFSDPFSNVAAGSFGQITGTSVNPRLMQLGLKLLF